MNPKLLWLAGLGVILCLYSLHLSRMNNFDESDASSDPSHPTTAGGRLRIKDVSRVDATKINLKGQYQCAQIPLRLLEPPLPGHTCCPPVTNRHEHYNGVSRSTTLIHYLSRYACFSPELSANRKRVRILRIGANTGQNLFANDLLTEFVMQGFAEALYLEPVPWLFKKLRETYQNAPSNVALWRAAVDNEDSVKKFLAPVPAALHRYWWFEMGGFNMPARSAEEVNQKKGLEQYFEWIDVQTVSMHSILRHPMFAPSISSSSSSTSTSTLLSSKSTNASATLLASPYHNNSSGQGGKGSSTASSSSAGRPRWPHVLLVDTEGHDGVIINHILDVARDANAIIPIIQFETKHLTPKNVTQLRTRLARIGYCSMRLDDDLFSYHLWAMRHSPEQCSTAFKVEKFS